VVVGGGAAGVITAAHLLERVSTRPGALDVAVTIVEKADVVGPGLAYSTKEPHHLLNNYAGRMSALEHDPDHFVRWCRAVGMRVGPETFVSRATYGRYLVELLGELGVPSGSSVTTVHDEAQEVTTVGGTTVVGLASGATLAADAVVLALGNPPPRRPRGFGAVADDRYAADPWDPRLLERVDDHDRVLLVGTGLTTVDVAAQLASSRVGVQMTAVSRHGLLPLRHVSAPPGPAREWDPGVSTLRAALGEARRCVAGGCEWRAVVESVKASANDLWSAMPAEEREQFVRHVARYWEIARHRMAPAMADIIEELLDAGPLRLATPAEVDPTTYDLVVNCTGPAPVSTPGWNPLVDHLALTGRLWPGPLGLGVDLDGSGALVDADGVVSGNIFAMGAARRGVEWEVAAVPDLRRQAQRLATVLCPSYAEPVGELAG
jgi:uncharacterized NAD(P)/FAD-binding protein YdhS